MPLNSPISVLIVDNITADCNAMVRAVAMFDNANVVGRTVTLEDAYAKVSSLKPDLIILSYELPGFHLDYTLTRLKSLSPGIEIILVSEKHRTTSESSLKALELGAMYFIKKPKESLPEVLIQYYYKYFRPVINLYTISRNHREIRNAAARTKSTQSSSPELPKKIIRSAIRSDFALMAVGSSLGGPEALKHFIPELPADFPLPIVITQHMPEGFTATMASVLDEISPLIVREARGGEILRPGYAYIAPGGKHLIVKRDAFGGSGKHALTLDDGPMVHGCRPSVDVMFNSIADNVGGNILAVVLTGMGSDGCEGVRNMKKNGKCFCITQDEATSVVYGMPAVVYKAGLSDMSLPLDNIPTKVNDLARAKSPMVPRPST